jgi:glycosyltransferase involved in cell wall biosynthesis
MNDKLKVLMVGLLPVDIEMVDGGVVAVTLNLLSSFSKISNVEIVFISFNMEIREEIVRQYSPNIRIHYLPYRIKAKLLDYFVNTKRLDEIIRDEKPDIIHIQEVTPHILRFIRFPKDRIVLTQHGIMSKEFQYAVGLKDKLQSLFKGFVEKKVFPVFRNVIFISDYNRSLFRGKNVFGEKIFNPVSPIFFLESGPSGEIDAICYVGRLNKNKNLGLVLRALGELKKEKVIYQLHVVGGYKDDHYEKEVMALMREYDLSNQVTFYGWQTQSQIIEVHAKCRIFVLPSQEENMPVAVGEALALGKVVVASNVGAISEMLTNGRSGFLFERNNLKQLSDQLRTLYKNEALIESVSVSAMKEAREKFHPDVIAKATLNFYRQVLNRRIANKA